MNLKKLERYLRVSLLGPGPRLLKKGIYRSAVSQILRNTALVYNIRRVRVNQDGLKLNDTHQLVVYAYDVNLLETELFFFILAHPVYKM